MNRFAIGLLAATICTPMASSAEPTMDPIEFGLRAKTMIDKTVTVKDCALVQMTLARGRCLIKSQSEIVGDYWFKNDGLPIDQTKRLIENCANMEANPNHCVFDISGIVTAYRNTVELVEPILYVQPK